MKFGAVRLTFIVIFLILVIVIFSTVSYNKDKSAGQEEGYTNFIDYLTSSIFPAVPPVSAETDTPLSDSAADDPNEKILLPELKSRKSKIQLVIARYNEKISFLEEAPFSNHEIILYNKGKSVKCRDCIKTVTLPNVGKCDHTYLYHIINNYDNLADITIFLPGSCLMNKMKSDKTYKTIKYAEKTETSVFIGNNFNDVYREMYGFHIDQHLTASEENQKMNSSMDVKPCKIRPFGKWYNSIFGNLNITLVDYTSIFAVSREHILQHPKSYYEKLISFVDDDVSPECGHYMERAWVAVFSPMPPECLYNNPL